VSIQRISDLQLQTRIVSERNATTYFDVWLIFRWCTTVCYTGCVRDQKKLVKKLPTCFRNPKLYYHVHHSQLPDPVLSQFNPLYAHNFIPYPRFILSATSHLLSGFHRYLFQSNIPTNIQQIFLTFTIRAMYPLPSPIRKLDLQVDNIWWAVAFPWGGSLESLHRNLASRRRRRIRNPVPGAINEPSCHWGT
jgi:hypothetical protein